MGWCFKIIEIWNLFDIWDFVYWNFWLIQVRVNQNTNPRKPLTNSFAFLYIWIIVICFRRTVYQNQGYFMNLVFLLKSSFLTTLLLGCGFLRLASEESTPPKLVVVIVVDQMRADHLSRFAGLYKGGFKRFLDQGAVFTNAHHGHYATETGPGHATIATGAHPSRHGIVANSWFDRIKKRRGAFGYGQDSNFPPLGYPDADPEDGRSPVNVLIPALGDWLKKNSPQSKVFSISRKSGSAVMMAGKKPDAAYWYHSDDGNIITSEYYLKSYPGWVKKFNESRIVDQFFEKGWQKLMPEETYFLAREDSFATENYGNNTSFPHNFESIEPDEKYYRALQVTPFTDKLILEFAKAIIKNENLGTDESPDILFLGCSSADAIGHTFGPLSQESLDHFLRLDIYLSEFFTFLDQQVGMENYIVALSSDHGVMPLPEELARRGFDAKRISVQDLFANIEKIFVEVGKDFEISAPLLVGRSPGLFLNYPAAESKGVSSAEINDMLIQKFKQFDSIADIFTREELTGKTSNGRPYYDLYKNGYHSTRSGDLILRYKEFYLLSRHPTSHGSPYAYDTHVPIAFLGAGVKAGFYSQKVQTVDIAPTLATFLNIKPTVEIDGKSLVGEIKSD